MDKNRVELFETRPIPSAVFTLAIPTILSSLVMVLYNLADTYFVGMMNNPIQNAAVTLAAPVLLAFNAVNNLFGVGTSSMMSRALGRKDMDLVERCSAIGFYFSVLSGIAFSLLCTVFKVPLLHILGASMETLATTNDYLFWTVSLGATPAILNVVMAYLVRSEGSTLHASIGTMSGCILNMILDPLFILPIGLNLGAAGAGMATFISNCFACCYFFLFLFKQKGKTHVSISPKKFSFDLSIIKGICAVGVPASIQNLLNVTGMTILNNFTSVYGSIAIAAMGISHKINVIPLQIALGLSQGIMPLVSYNYASGNKKRMKEAIQFTLTLATSFLCILLVIYWTQAESLIRLFMNNEEVVHVGIRFLKGMCLSLPFMGIDFITVGVFQATGNGKMAFLFAILRKVIFEIPCLFILNALFPLFGLAYAADISEFILASIAIYFLFFKQSNSMKKEQ